VESIEDNLIAKTTQLPVQQTQTSATWGLDRIDQKALPLGASYSYTYAGQGIFAYVLDTGINPTHVDFQVSATNTSSRVILGQSYIAGTTNSHDDQGHGTHCAGTIGGLRWGVAKEVTLVAVKVLNSAGSGTYDGIISGINWVVADTTVSNSKKVINLSLGGGASSTLDNAVARAVQAGELYGREK
jgi:subtilisin family serine protease